MTETEPTPSLPEDLDARCDILVIGGGLHGCGIARDLAGRGWSVLLCEQDDLAAHTSSSSSKLVHGGVGELAQGHMASVRKALMEREGLLRSAPHITSAVRFVVPHDESWRPLWMMRMGVWMYDHLAPRQFLPDIEQIGLSDHPAGQPLRSEWPMAFLGADGCVDDARLVVLCAQDARDQGARILTRTRCTDLRSTDVGWQALLSHHDPHDDRLTHQARVHARLVVNAAGPWATQVHSWLTGGAPSTPPVRWMRGSHIVVPRLFAHDMAYLLPERDGRVVMAMPYEQAFTLIGATDAPQDETVFPVRATSQDIDELCQTVNRYFKSAIGPADVVWHFAGLHPQGERARGSAMSSGRDHRLESIGGPSPSLTVWGGPLTTYRRLAEEAAGCVGDLLNDQRDPWTRHATLPGGRLTDLIDAEVDPGADVQEFQRRLRLRHPWMDLTLARRWTRQFGAQTLGLLEGVTSRNGLGAEVAPGLHELELHHLIRQEWACTGEDVLWRRTKLGLHYNAAQREAVQRWMQRSRAQPLGSRQ